MTPATDFADQGPANNPIDRLHPKTRLVMTLAILIFATIIHNPIVLAISMAAAIILVRIAKAPWHKLRHRLLHLEGFMIVLLVLLPFTMPGRPLLELGPLVATVEGTVRALTVAIKVNICVLPSMRCWARSTRSVSVRLPKVLACHPNSSGCFSSPCVMFRFSVRKRGA